MQSWHVDPGGLIFHPLNIRHFSQEDGHFLRRAVPVTLYSLSMILFLAIYSS